jgi:hypothetical protein
MPSNNTKPIALHSPRAQMNRKLFAGLKPGGVLVIADHSAKADSDPRSAKLSTASTRACCAVRSKRRVSSWWPKEISGVHATADRPGGQLRAENPEAAVTIDCPRVSPFESKPAPREAKKSGHAVACGTSAASCVAARQPHSIARLERKAADRRCHWQTADGLSYSAPLATLILQIWLA